MKWTGFAGVAMCAALAGAGGCKDKPSGPNTGSGTGSQGSNAQGTGSGTGAGSSAPVASNPTPALVKAAFGGNVPAFPLLAKDGSAVAVGVESPVGGSEVSTYNVATFNGWTATPDTWGGAPPAFTIVDSTMAAMLLDSAMGEDAPAPDPETLKTRAAAVTKFLADGEFSPFDGPVVTLGPNDTAVGPAKLRVTHEPEAALTVHLLDAGGAELASHTTQRHTMGHVADLECVSTPVARRAWLDAKRKRILVEIGWNVGAPMCSAPDAEYGLWPIP